MFHRPNWCVWRQGWLPDGQASEHEEGDRVHRQRVPQGSYLAAEDSARQASVPGAAGDRRLVQHGRQPLETGAGATHVVHIYIVLYQQLEWGQTVLVLNFQTIKVPT